MEKFQFNQLQKMSNVNIKRLYDQTLEKATSIRESSNKLDKKSYLLLGVYTSVIGAISSFSIQSQSFDNFAPYIVLSLGYIGSMVFLLKSVKAKSYYGIGFRPRDIVNDLDKFYLEDEKGFLALLIKFYDKSLDHNATMDQSRGENINRAIFIFSLSLACFVIMLTLSHLDLGQVLALVLALVLGVVFCSS